MKSQYKLSLLSLLTTLTLVGCGGGSGSGSNTNNNGITEVFGDSGSKFDSTLVSSRNGVTKNFISRANTQNISNPESFVYEYSNNINYPFISNIKFRLDESDPNNYLELMYDFKNNKIIDITYRLGNADPINTTLYFCEQACSGVTVQNIDQLTGSSTIKFNNTKIKDFTFNGVLSGSIYSKPISGL